LVIQRYESDALAIAKAKDERDAKKALKAALHDLEDFEAKNKAIVDYLALQPKIAFYEANPDTPGNKEKLAIAQAALAGSTAPSDDDVAAYRKTKAALTEAVRKARALAGE
jgi:hypothetical protein